MNSIIKSQTSGPEPWYAPAGTTRGLGVAPWWNASIVCGLCKNNHCEVHNDLRDLFSLFCTPNRDDDSFIEIHYPSKDLYAYIKGDILAKEYSFGNASAVSYFKEEAEVPYTDNEVILLNEAVELIFNKIQTDPEYLSHLSKHEVLVLGL